MKKLFLSFLLLGATAIGTLAGEYVVDFYFLDPTSVELRPKRLLELWKGENSPLVQDGSKNNYICRITDMEVVSEGVTMTASLGEGTSEPRFFWAGGTNVDNDDLYIGDFRAYKSNKIRFTAPEGCSILSVVMHPKVTTKNETGCCDKIKIDEACGGIQKITGGTNSWTAPEGGVKEVSYTIGPKAKTQTVYRLYVTLDKRPSAVAEINVSDNAPAEYYNLSGVRCDASDLQPGIYLCRRGSKTLKVVIKPGQN